MTHICIGCPYDGACSSVAVEVGPGEWECIDPFEGCPFDPEEPEG